MTWQFAHVAGSFPMYEDPLAYQKAYAPTPMASPAAAAASVRGTGRRENPRLEAMDARRM
jgi:hypothetical protein